MPDATEALTCIQGALGGPTAVNAVASLYLVGTTRPLQDSGMRPVPGTREMSVVFPDRYRRTDRGQPLRPGEGSMISAVGFDREVVLSNPREPDPKRAQSSARHDFARQMLMRLPRKLDGIRFSPRLITDSGRPRLAIDAFGPESFRATLLVDRKSCVPVALQFVLTGTDAWRVDLSEYRAFGGIKFPTLLRESTNGAAFREERVTAVEVNTPTAAKSFSTRR